MLQAPNFSMIEILAIFLATVWLLNRFLFGPLTAILKEREAEEESSAERFARARDEFEAAARRIEESLSAARQEALKLREDLRAEGRRLREEKVGALRRETTRRIEEESAAIGEDTRRAAAELPARSAELARILAEKVLGRPVAA